jgi:tripartite ATP-independent transporter DctM subunit
VVVDYPAAILLVVSFFGLMFLTVPILFAMIASSIITIMYLRLPVELVVLNMVKGINLYSLMAVPFFILAGEIMSQGGIIDRLLALSNALVGWARGGLAMVNIVASVFFGGISGSSAADTAAIGSITIPMMKKNGYETSFATSVIMASSVEAMLIPPSHNMVLFALAAGNVSIARLFLGGVIPGLALAFALMIYTYYIAKKRKYPISQGFDMKVALRTSVAAIPALGTILIVVFGVVAGIFTATESAAFAVLYALVVGVFFYKELNAIKLYRVFATTLRTLAIVIILVGASASFSWIIAYLQIPAAFTSLVLSITTNKILILLFVNILLLFAGCLMDMASLILITTPIILPMVVSVGMNPVHYGVLIIMNLGIGLITPPVGTTLFVGSAISKLSIEELSKAMLPFFAVMIIVLLVITYVPEIVLFLPDLMMPLNK